MASLNTFLVVKTLLVDFKKMIYNRVWGMDLHPTCSFSLSARFDKTFPAGVHVGPDSYVAFEATILTHDRTRRMYKHTRVGARCFIGARSMILPGVEIGDECVVGAGSVVVSSVPARSLVAGNPARIIRSGIEVGVFGQFLEPRSGPEDRPEAGSGQDVRGTASSS